MCSNGCAFQRIDVATRTITSQKTHPVSAQMYGPLTIAGDPKCGNIIAGYGVPVANDPFATQGFRLQSFDY